MTVDEILAQREYRDRRGRYWTGGYIYEGMWYHFPSDRLITSNRMRLLIERDQHECHPVGMNYCSDHPAVSVLRSSEERVWYVFDRFEDHCHGPAYPTWNEAMDAARALAVGE